MFKLWLNVYQTKARNPGNTVIAAMNPVFDHLSHCENFFIFGSHLGHSRLLEVIRRSNTRSVAATGFPGFIAFV